MDRPEVEERIAELVHLRYRRLIPSDAEEGFLAEAPELPGCVTARAAESEALENLHGAMDARLEDSFERGDTIPGPPRRRPPTAPDPAE
jgi:predicted RNase H-like HicB family nuclease